MRAKKSQLCLSGCGIHNNLHGRSRIVWNAFARCLLGDPGRMLVDAAKPLDEIAADLIGGLFQCSAPKTCSCFSCARLYGNSEAMFDTGVIQEWLSLLFRWAHIVAAISWIGSSFYFMWLDSSLKRRDAMAEGVKGENWTVHGGGFYHTQKYMVAPDEMPSDLHWFRWESYFTWITGFLLMAVTYYWGASIYLIDRTVADLAPWQAIAISVAGLGFGWVVYDLLCKSPLRTQPTVMFAVLFAALVAATWAYGQVFSARAAFIQVGATIATFMTCNVFLVIIPNQRIVVADLRAGRVPDARYGEIAKLRSTHNNYLTLPVIFLMISNHYPDDLRAQPGLGTGRAGPADRRRGAPLVQPARSWANRVRGRMAMAGDGGLDCRSGGDDGLAARNLHAEIVDDATAMTIVSTHCTTCHAAAPSHEAFDEAPAGLVLETAAAVRLSAQKVLAQAVMTNAMPLGNETAMTAEDRATLGAWLRAPE